MDSSLRRGTLALLATAFLANFADAQGRYDGSVAPAAATAPVPLPPTAGTSAIPQPAQVVRFGKRPSQPGDLVLQNVNVGLDLTTRFTQSGQIANESQTTMQRQQRRRVEILEVEGERMNRARITFEHSRSRSPENANPAELLVQPVEGKSYLLTRQGEAMRVTDEAGQIPPLEEFKLVSDVADNLGKSNPLAPILLERPIAVGQRLLVPRDVASTLLGLREQVGSIKRFELTLERLEPTPVLPGRHSAEPPSDLAVFAARIETLPNESTPLELTLTGQVKIEVDTCRSVAAEFTGPVQMSTIERTRADVFQFSAAGKLSIVIHSDYDRSAATPRVASAR